MKRKFAVDLYRRAMAHLKRTRPDMLKEARKVGDRTLRTITPSQFLTEYCWVVYASGFRFSTLEAKFPSIRKAFCTFDVHRLAGMRSVKPVLKVFNNERKAASFLAGAKVIAREGFDNFKERLTREGVSALEELPGIGPITKFHLAKNIGLIDKAKPDIWLVRAATLCNCSVDELVGFVSDSQKESQHLVDVAIWHYGADANFGRTASSASQATPGARA